MSLQRLCDLCEKPIRDEDEYFNLHIYENQDSINYSRYLPRMDLCSDCYHKVFSKKEGEEDGKDN